MVVASDAKVLFRARLEPDAPSPPIDLPITLQPGANHFRFTTNRPAVAASGGDPRKLAFVLEDFRISR